MTAHNGRKRYWKDALREMQLNLDNEPPPAQHRRWSSAYRQAQADLHAPGAIVWLPDEVVDLFKESERPRKCQDASNQSGRRPLTALLWVILLLLPAVVSYLLAYRRIIRH